MKYFSIFRAIVLVLLVWVTMPVMAQDDNEHVSETYDAERTYVGHLDMTTPLALSDTSREARRVAAFKNPRQRPIYVGGEVALQQQLAKNLQAPLTQTKKNRAVPTSDNARGIVVVRFVVSAKGKVTHAFIQQGVSPYRNAQAVQAVLGLGKFIPAVHDGQKVAAWVVLPIRFD